MAVPTGNHTDWIWPFSLIPRAWTAIEGWPPPTKIAGNTDDLKPIPDPGNWIITWPFYVAFQTSDGWYFRIGFRWDDVDHYFQFPSFKIGKYG